MSAKDASVCNTDLLQSAKFLFSIPRLTSTQFFCQSVNVPGISTQNTIQSTPFVDLNIPGDKVVYDPLTIEFLLDEELQSWLAVHDWIRGIGKVKEFDEYKNLDKLSRYSQTVKYPQYAEAELISLSASNNQKIKFHFIDLFPISLSRIDFDVRVGSEKTMTSSATFKFKRYDVIKL
jgi:hypothetical protein